jgi:lipooligosaccharide transport system permease protein
MTVVPDLRVRSAVRLWQRNATIYRRSYKASIVPNFFEPFFYLLAMGLGLGAYLSSIQGVRYIDYIAPGLVATAAMYGSSFEVTYNCFVKLHFGKVYDAIAATPLSPEDIATGELMWATTRSVLYGTVFLLIAAMFGVVHTPLVVFAPVAVALIGLMFALIGLTYTALVPLIDYFSFYWTMFMTPMFLFAGIFFPLTRLPGWVRTLAWFVPLHQGVDLMRAVVLTGDVGRAAGSALWILVVDALLFLVPLRLMRRRLVR